MATHDDSATYWRVRDMWGAFTVAGALIAFGGYAVIEAQVERRASFLFLGAIFLVLGCSTAALVVQRLRWQRLGSGQLSPQTWPRDGVKRVHKAIRRGRDIDLEDVEVARRYLRRTTWDRQRLVINMALLLIFLACTMGLSLQHHRVGDLAIPVLGLVLTTPSLIRQYRIRRWSDRHPDIAYDLFEPNQPQH